MKNYSACKELLLVSHIQALSTVLPAKSDSDAMFCLLSFRDL